MYLWSKSKISIIWYHSYVESNFFLKMKQINLFTKQKQTYRDWKQAYVPQGEMWLGGGINQELEKRIHTLIYADR